LDSPFGGPPFCSSFRSTATRYPRRVSSIRKNKKAVA
jgi:hypothetical protein